MTVGLFHTAQWPEGTTQLERFQQSVSEALLAEELGFDSIWLTEHHFFRHGIVSDSLAYLAYLAGKTSRIRLGTGVAVLPLHHPIRLAETTAIIDLLSGGRLDLGIGKGYQVGEFKGLGVGMEDRDARFDEALDVLLKGWATTDPFSHDGRFWTFEDANPQPKPLQSPHPPVWFATESDIGFRRIAENGWGLMLPQGRSPETVADQVERFKAALKDSGQDYDPSRVILARAMYCGASDERAWDEVSAPYIDFVTKASSLAAPGRGLLAGAAKDPFTLDAELRSSAMFGSPETCLEMLGELRSIGIERVIAFVHIGGLQRDQIESSMRLFASEVLPAVG